MEKVIIEQFVADYIEWFKASEEIEGENSNNEGRLLFVPAHYENWQQIDDWKVKGDNLVKLLNAYKYGYIVPWKGLDFEEVSKQMEKGVKHIRETLALARNAKLKDMEQEEKYIAKVKGWELFTDLGAFTFNYDKQNEVLSIGSIHLLGTDTFILEMTKQEWAEYGVTEEVADFERVGANV